MIDAHHHLWRYVPEDFAWIGPGMESIARDFLADELARDLAASGVTAAVSVQARQSVEETRVLLEVAAEYEQSIGVVGWLPLRDSDLLARHLAEFADAADLVGVRHVVQDEPAGFLLGDAFNAGVAETISRGLTYDILIFPPQLDEATEFVARHESGRFVVDHLAKPSIRPDRFDDDWRNAIARLARHDNVAVKWSGLTTEVVGDVWNDELLRPYWDTILELFGPERIMLGSDWPVCLLRTEYRRWFECCEKFVGELSSPEQRRVREETAIESYNLKYAVSAAADTPAVEI
ncbi:MAG: amidohydrolase family protein [Planctomycetota bacterium]